MNAGRALAGYLLLGGLLAGQGATLWWRHQRPAPEPPHRLIMVELAALGWMPYQAEPLLGGSYARWIFRHPGCAHPLSVLPIEADREAMGLALGQAGDWQGVRFAGQQREGLPLVTYRLRQGWRGWWGLPREPLYRISLAPGCLALLKDGTPPAGH
ncbi:hypothetical protein [Aeromonas diversa]|uniref:hypothetical protein n=1 Tax=Aeromonas diversa TaxID=502790 RepID=UPI003462A471